MLNCSFVRLGSCALTGTLLATLLACGGGTSTGDPSVLLQSHPVASNAGPITAMAAAAAPKRAATARTLDATSFLNWAEGAYPSLFEAPQSNQTIDVWTYRYYPKTDIYLGVNTSGDVLGLVGTGGTYNAVPLGKIESFGCTVYPSDCAVTPPASGSTTYNECVDPAAMTLPTGFNTRLVNTWVGLITGEETVKYLIEGRATFEGQSAVKSKRTMTGSQTILGVSQAVNSRGWTYEKVQSNGLIVMLGAESEFDTAGFSANGYTFAGFTTASKTVYSPAVEEREFTLKVGESVTVAHKGSNSNSGGPLPPSTVPFDYSVTYTYVARETVPVSGRNFDTCKYTIKASDSSIPVTFWFLVGKGIPVKSESTSSAGIQQVLFKSGTYNGVPI